MPVVKPEGERLSKTVLPNKMRKLAPPPDPLQVAAGLKSASKMIPEATPRAKESRSSVASSRELPTAIALALEPKTERTISIRLADILDRLPAGYIKSPETFDRERSILLRASEIEKGMASGQPTVSLASIYVQVPEIFVHSPNPTRQCYSGCVFYSVYKNSGNSTSWKASLSLPFKITLIIYHYSLLRYFSIVLQSLLLPSGLLAITVYQTLCCLIN